MGRAPSTEAATKTTIASRPATINRSNAAAMSARFQASSGPNGTAKGNGTMSGTKVMLKYVRARDFSAQGGVFSNRRFRAKRLPRAQQRAADDCLRDGACLGTLYPLALESRPDRRKNLGRRAAST